MATDPGRPECILSLDDDLVRSYLGRIAGRVARMLAGAPGALARRRAVLAVAWAQHTAERRHSAVRRDLLRFDEQLDTTLAFAGHRE